MQNMAEGTYEPQLSANDFRARRHYLPASAFALVSGPYEGAIDLIPEMQWHQLMSWPTDVLLRTTDQHGSQLAQLNGLWSRWVETLPLAQEAAPFMFNAAWDAADDFSVSTFNAAHGYYRQGLANLRGALEGLTLAASFAERHNAKGLDAWLSGEREPPKFGNARDMIASTLGAAITNILRQLYKELSSYIHSGPGGTNAELWEGSNGPIFVPSSFQKVYRNFRDVMAMGYVLLSIGWPAFAIPEYVLPLFETPNGAWSEATISAVKETFVSPAKPR